MVSLFAIDVFLTGKIQQNTKTLSPLFKIWFFNYRENYESSLQ